MNQAVHHHLSVCEILRKNDGATRPSRKRIFGRTCHKSGLFSGGQSWPATPGLKFDPKSESSEPLK